VGRITKDRERDHPIKVKEGSHEELSGLRVRLKDRGSERSDGDRGLD